MSPSGNRRRPLVADRRKSTSTKRKGSGGSGGGGGRRPAKRKTTRRKKAQRGGFLARSFRFIGRLIWGVIWRSAAVVTLILALATGYYFAQLPDVTELLDARQRGSVTMLDRHGEVFAWRGEQFGGAITPDTASPHLVNAVVATEDRRFWRHLGISPRGIASAIRINLSEGRGPLSGHGGSTITQQVAKLLCLGRGYDPEEYETEAEYEQDCRRTTLWRKIQEVPFSFAMELRYSKAEILSVYLNRAYLGAGARGFEAASQRYFGIASSEVDPQQSAMLAGLLSAPSYYAPTRDLQRSQERANVVLNLMERQGYLSASAADSARANPATLSSAARQDTGGYFADWIMSVGPDFLTGDTTEDVIIRTTFDPAIQAAAEASIANVFAEQVRAGSEAEAAIVVMSADGAVRAMVGGRDLAGGGLFNRATQALRQPGSAFKPFVYATALDLGWRFDDMVLDAELCIDVAGSGPYCPENYTNQFYGMVTLTEALQSSLNTAAVRMSEEVGRDLVRTVASQFGIESDLAAGPALALGASESTLIEMTGAYAGILNGGSAVLPYGMTELRLLGEDAPMFEQETGIRERVIAESSARQLIYMMSRVVAEGSGQRAALPDRPVAGKTGTTNSARDAWFVGFTADYVAGVWMGYDDNRPLSGVTGGGLPSEIWRQAMEQIHADIAPRPLPMIDPIAEAGRGQRGGAADDNPFFVDNGILRGPVTPEGTRIPINNGQGDIGNAVNNLLGRIFGPRQ
ncbi:transglycosylase domain-containing protein [Jannaschia sp. CCS1]|uniref:transglycosylase domain-containing protein n=1 Tax=Jannaschia sp. (strain CCS1) TaxID=290400 RepID=UPI000053B42D|nr:transglycosylase domain-containing protein [Jannaschia sp. CCS1]ABD56972.1 Peptidoglycan glycosyltransferase [Jannaschia sp. CCS1]